MEYHGPINQSVDPNAGSKQLIHKLGNKFLMALHYSGLISEKVTITVKCKPTFILGSIFSYLDITRRMDPFVVFLLWSLPATTWEHLI